MYEARRYLGDKTTLDIRYSDNNNIYLAESFTELNRELFKDCLAVFGQHLEFKYIWTHNSKIFLCEDKDSPVIHVKSRATLEELKITESSWISNSCNIKLSRLANVDLFTALCLL